jgi:hypothetical protein
VAESRFSVFVQKLHNDAQFRKRFANHPADVLREFGLDPDLLDLPHRIDLAELEKRIAESHRGNARWTIPDAADAQRLTADELWERFHFIRLKTDANFAVSVTASISGVIYGTTATTNTVITTAGSSSGLQSFDQITRLRELSRLPKHQLRFSVTSSSDGIAVGDLTADTIRAFLGRVS